MTAYSVPGKGWRYHFQVKGKRYTDQWFQTKREAKLAESAKRREIADIEVSELTESPTDMGFLHLVNLRLDHVKEYNSESHYRTYLYMARRWVKRWGDMLCVEMTPRIIQEYLIERKGVSAYTANKELRYLRAMFSQGKRKDWVQKDPTESLDFFPVEKSVKYVPSPSDIDRVIAEANPDTQDYLWTIRETMGRMSEINQLRWEDIDLETKTVILYTRKKRGGHRTPRRLYMTAGLHEILSRRNSERVEGVPWVFWHRYWSRRKGDFVVGPFDDRKKLMKKLCSKAGVRYFRYHALRHSGASLMDNAAVPIGAIQRILGHENRKTTEIYLHSIGEAERDAMRAYEHARQNAHTDPHMERKKGYADLA